MITGKRLELIHYGSSKFVPEKVLPVKNIRMNNKPNGGIWTSPTDSRYGWKDWCEAEGWGITSKHFAVEFNGTALVINSKDDLDLLPWVTSDTVPWIDFESL